MVKKKRSSGRKSKAIPMAIAVPAVAEGVHLGKMAMAGEFDNVRLHMTGVSNDGKFYGKYVLQTYGPLVGGALVHKVANSPKLGINRMIRKASFGFLEI